MSSPTSIAEPASSTLSVRDAQRLETRARLFDAAVAEIGRSGLAGADVSTIAAAAGVARGTFYFHFPTKEHVVVEVERAQEAKIVARLGTRQRERTDVLDIFGLPFHVVAPRFVMRQFVKIGVFLPDRLGFAFVGAAEMAGCVMFDELRRVGIELFADEPDVAARIERLYSEILTDEVGHVGYCAARCTPTERALMRWHYPRFARLLLARP